MALPSVRSEVRVGILLLSVLSLLSARLVGASQDSGNVIPAESRYLLHPVLPALLHCTPAATRALSSTGTWCCLINEGVMMNLCHVIKAHGNNSHRNSKLAKD